MEDVKRMLAKPDLVNDLTGGLDAHCLSKAFLTRRTKQENVLN